MYGSGNPGRQIHRDLLVADRDFERGFFARRERVDDLLLLLFDSTRQGEHLFDFRVVGMARELMR
jgi:hypothetical protein